MPKIKNLEKIEPLNHSDFLKLLIKTKLLITDSGGLQEEGSFFNKKIIYYENYIKCRFISFG